MHRNTESVILTIIVQLFIIVFQIDTLDKKNKKTYGAQK